MRLAIIGLGKMGREVAAMAASRGHEVVWTLSRAENPGGAGLTPERLSAADVVLEFTAPDAAVANLLALGQAGATVVSGTTGWQRELPRVAEAFARGGGALVHGTNFSVGVRLYLETARAAAERFPRAGYAAYLVEEHHAEKRDAPSGNGEDDRRGRRGGERRGPARHERARRDDSGPPPSGVRVSRGRGRADSPRPRTRRVRQGSRLGGRAHRGPQGRPGVRRAVGRRFREGQCEVRRLEGVRDRARHAVRRKGPDRLRRAGGAGRLADHRRASTSSCRAARRASPRRSRATSARP